MADRVKITEMIGAIKACFPYFGGGVNPEVLVSTWDMLLKDYSNEEITRATFRALQSSDRAPSPATIIEKITETRKASEQSEEELWGIYHEALIRGNRLYHDFPLSFVESNGLTQGQNARIAFSELFRSLPWQVQSYLAAESEFKEKAKNLDREEISFERNRFSKALPMIESRKDLQRLLATEGTVQETLQTRAILQSISERA